MNKRFDYPLEQHPFHKDDNVSGVNGDPNNDGWGIEIHTLQVPEVLEVQKAYVVYLPAGGEITVELSATSKRFAVERIHAADGNSRPGKEVGGGCPALLLRAVRRRCRPLPPERGKHGAPAMNRRLALGTLGTLGLILCAFAQPLVTHGAEDKSAIYLPAAVKAPATAPLPLPAGPHLFLDESLIESRSNVTRRVNVPSRDPAIPNPLVTGQEDGCFQPYLTALRDPQTGRFRLWYGVHTADFNSGQSHLGYLESADGIRWNRPHRVLPDPAPIQFGVSVLDEGLEHLNPAQRFKFGWYHASGLRVAASPDGLSWTVLSPEVVLAHNHDINGLFWDPLRKRYVATISSYVTGPSWSGQRRVTQQSTSANLLQWREASFVLTPDDRLDEGETQFYAMDGYLRRGDLLIGMVKVLRDDLKADSPPDPPDAYGIGYTTLAWSHDGAHWVRDREPFFDRSPQRGAWDHAHAWIDEQLPVGDEVYLYYGGYQRGHKVNRFEERQIGLVRMKRDRYVARESGSSGGSFKTPLVILNVAAMTLNADAHAGEVRVQVLAADGQPIPGFNRTDCDAIRGDVLAAPVRWVRPLSVLGDRPVRLEFFLTNARLFALELHQESALQ